MKLLTENQKTVLRGDAGGLDVPNGVRVYLVQGLPTVFRLAGSETDTHNPERWLHIPAEMLGSIRHSLMVQGSNTQFSHIADTGIEIDDARLYPVLVSGEVRAVIAVGAGIKLNLNGNTRDALLVSLKNRYLGQDRREEQDLVGELLRCLFARDRSYDQFQKAVLELMTKQWPGTLGAVYFESQGLHQLRLAIGDIHLSDRLEGTLTGSTAQHWGEAIRRRQFFIPADMVPDYPVIGGYPPNYMFVHPGVLSDRTEYMLVLAMPGNIGLSEVAALKRIARLAGHIHESQFSTTSEVMSLYSRLRSEGKTDNSVEDMLTEVHRVVSRQLALSRILLCDTDGNGALVLSGDEGAATVATESQPPLPDDLIDALKDTATLLIPRVSREPLLASRRDEYLKHDVHSEFIVALDQDADRLSYVAFGSPLTGDHLQKHRDLLQAVGQFLSLWLDLQPRLKAPNDVVYARPPEESVVVAHERLNTVAKLAGGYFHDLMEHLSVVVGQNELIESAMVADDAALASRVIISGSSKVQKAADRIAAYLGNLRDLCLLTPERLERPLSSRRLLTDLPEIVSGHARQVRDTKNIVLSIKTVPQAGEPFDLTYRHLYDYVLPFVLHLMDEAIASGSMTVTAAVDNKTARLIFNFPADVIGHLELGELLGRVYSHWQLEDRGHEGTVHLDDADLEFRMSSEHTCTVIINMALTALSVSAQRESESAENKKGENES